MRTLIAVSVLMVLSIPLSASSEGALYLQQYLETYENGVAGASLFVYDSEGALLHSGTGNGSYQAGNSVPVEEGWYWVEVGRNRTEANLQKLYVRDGRTTVVPSGWVSVSTLPVAEQPRSCDQWNAELNAFRRDHQGREQLIGSNRGTGVDDYGMLQLPVGEVVVYFHGFPVTVEVQDGQVYRLPAGFQGPVTGERGQVALHGEGAEENVVMALCEEDNLHLPAGDYWVSRIVPSDVYPFEERVWTRAVVAPVNEAGYFDVRAERVGHRFAGDGAEPVLITAEDGTVLTNYRRGAVAGSSDSGFDNLFD